jgi:hypothetical protein
VIALLVLSVSLTALAADPKAEEVLDNYVKVTGGKEAYEKVKSRVIEGTMAMPAQGINGTLTIYNRTPDRIFMTMMLDQVGKIERGYDGKVGWETNAMTGARILKGEELEGVKREAESASELHWRDNYTDAKHQGIVDVKGKQAHKLEMTNKLGKSEHRYYDAASGLLLQSEMDVETPQGQVHVVATPSDYRDVDGIKVPFKSSQQISIAGMQIEQTMQMTKVQQNVEIPDEKFKLPADIEALLKKQSSVPATGK